MLNGLCSTGVWLVPGYSCEDSLSATPRVTIEVHDVPLYQTNVPFLGDISYFPRFWKISGKLLSRRLWFGYHGTALYRVYVLLICLCQPGVGHLIGQAD